MFKREWKLNKLSSHHFFIYTYMIAVHKVRLLLLKQHISYFYKIIYHKVLTWNLTENWIKINPLIVCRVCVCVSKMKETNIFLISPKMNCKAKPGNARVIIICVCVSVRTRYQRGKHGVNIIFCFWIIIFSACVDHKNTQIRWKG